MRIISHFSDKGMLTRCSTWVGNILSSILLACFVCLGHSVGYCQLGNNAIDTIILHSICNDDDCNILQYMPPQDYGKIPLTWNIDGNISPKQIRKMKRADWVNLFCQRHRLSFSKYVNPAIYYECDSCQVISVEPETAKESPYRGLIVYVAFTCVVGDYYVSPYNFLQYELDSATVRWDVEHNGMARFREWMPDSTTPSQKDTFCIEFLASEWDTMSDKSHLWKNERFFLQLDGRINPSQARPIVAVRYFAESEVDTDLLYSKQELYHYYRCKYCSIVNVINKNE